MFMIIAIISIASVAGVAWALQRVIHLRLCPICAGVSLTWAWMLGLLFVGYPIEPAVPATLLGGSVVGAAYQLERFLPLGRSRALWKAVSIPAGFLAAYALLHQQLGLFSLAAGAVSLVAAQMFRQPGGRQAVASRELANAAIVKLEKKMEDCC